MNDIKITLIQREYTKDDIGNSIPDESKTIVYADEISVTRSEFYNAKVDGLRPEKVFRIRRYEYDGQDLVEYDGIRYQVIRAYSQYQDTENIELTCERDLKK